MIKLGKIEKRHAILLIFCGLLILGYFFPGKLWSISFLFFMPLSVQIFFWILILILFFYETTNFLDKSATRFSKWLFENLSEMQRDILLFIFTGLIIVIFRCKHFYWGDSHVIIRWIEKFTPLNPFYQRGYLTQFIYWIITTILSFTSIHAFEIIFSFHVIAGGLFVVIVTRISKSLRLNNLGRLVFLLISVSSSIFLQFTHIELYGIAIVTATWTIYWLVKDWNNEGIDRYRFIFPLVLTIALNPLYLYLAIVFLFLVFKKKRNSIIALIATLTVIIVYISFNFIIELPFRNLIIPVIQPDYFFSISHWLTVLNFSVFLSPAILTYMVFKREKLSYQSEILSGLCITCALLLPVLYLGFGVMDWDLAASILLPLLILTSYRVASLSQRLSITILSIAFVFLCGQLFLNLDNSSGKNFAETSIMNQYVPYYDHVRPPADRILMINLYQPKRFQNAKEISYWGIKAIEEDPYSPRPYLYLISHYAYCGKSNLAAYYGIIGFEKGATDSRTSLRLLQVIKSKEDDHILPSIEKILEEMTSERTFKLSDSLINELELLQDSTEIVSKARKRTLDEVLMISIYIDNLSKRGEGEKALTIYSGAKRLYPASKTIELAWGNALLYLKRTKEARIAYQKAMELGLPKGTAFNNIGISYSYENDIQKTAFYMRKAAMEFSGSFEMNRNYALALWLQGKKNEAIEHMEEFVIDAKYKQAELGIGYLEKLEQELN